MDTFLDVSAPDVLADPYPHFARLRREVPVGINTSVPGMGTVWMLSRHDDISAFLKDPRTCNDRNRATNKPDPGERWWMPKVITALTRTMLSQDAPNHRRLRNLVHLAFTPKRVEQLNGRVETLVAELLDAAAKRGGFDLIADYALPVPMTIISELMGVPEPERAGFQKLMSEMIDNGNRGARSQFFAIPRMIRLVRFFQRLIRLRTREPADDLTTALIQARDEGQQLSEQETVAMLFLLLLAGHETTVNLIGTGTLSLLEQPDQFARLREEPAVLDSAVEELLRFTNPVPQLVPRWVNADVTYRGVTIPAGSTVFALVGSANRDEEVFEHAHRVDVGRTPNRHLAFGLGAHYCMGAPLARLEAKVALRELARRFPDLQLAVPRDQLQWRGTLTLRGLRSLPLRLAGAAARAA